VQHGIGRVANVAGQISDGVLETVQGQFREPRRERVAALMPHQTLTKPFGIFSDVVAEPLCDDQPNGIGRKRQRVMSAEGAVDSLDDRMPSAADVIVTPHLLWYVVH
jgi:hypothetical protein